MPARAPIRAAFRSGDGHGVAGDDADRRADLRRMKRVATGLFVAMTVLFVVTRVVESRWGSGSWIGFVRATAEASMVGALADWFAVTALFRHPLRIPIPHTAIIPARKNQIGRGLGEFVQKNFASGALLAERVAGVQPARRLADWLAHDDNIATVARAAAGGLRWGVGELRDDEITGVLERIVVERAKALDVAPLLGRALAAATADDRHQEVVDETLRTVVRLLDANRGELWANFLSSAPWWVPERVDANIFDRLFFAGRALLDDASRDRHHPLRRRLDRRIAQLSDDLQQSVALADKVSGWRDAILDDATVRAWIGSLWTDAKARLLADADNPASTLRQRLNEAIAGGARQLREDESLQLRLDGWVVNAVRNLADEHGHEIANLVSTTVERWDAHDTADRIELQVGRDLQFIRINGTLVGGLAGLIIYAVSRLIG